MTAGTVVVGIAVVAAIEVELVGRVELNGVGIVELTRATGTTGPVPLTNGVVMGVVVALSGIVELSGLVELASGRVGRRG